MFSIQLTDTLIINLYFVSATIVCLRVLRVIRTDYSDDNKHGLPDITPHLSIFLPFRRRHKTYTLP